MSDASGYQWSIAYYIDHMDCAICGGDHYWEQCRTAYTSNSTSPKQYYDDQQYDSSAEEIDFGYMRAQMAEEAQKLFQSKTEKVDILPNLSESSASSMSDSDGEAYSLLSAEEIAFLQELGDESDDEGVLIVVNPAYQPEPFVEEFEYPMFEVGYTIESEIPIEEEVPQPMQRMVLATIPMQSVAEPEEEALIEKKTGAYVQRFEGKQVEEVEVKPRFPFQRKRLDLSIYTFDDSPTLPEIEAQAPDALLLEQNGDFTDLHRGENMQEEDVLLNDDHVGVRRNINHRKHRPRLRKKRNKKERLKARLVDTLASSLSPLRRTHWNSGKQAKWRFR